MIWFKSRDQIHRHVFLENQNLPNYTAKLNWNRIFKTKEYRMRKNVDILIQLTDIYYKYIVISGKYVFWLNILIKI